MKCLLDITDVGNGNTVAGELFENLVVVEALKARLNRGVRAGLYYIRGKSGSEIDLVVEEARRIHGIEVKSSKTPDDSFAENMNKFTKSVAPLESKSVVYSGEAWPIADGGKFVNFKDTAKLIDAMK